MKNRLKKIAFFTFCGAIICTSIYEGGKHHNNNNCSQCSLATGKGKSGKTGSVPMAGRNYREFSELTNNQ